MNDFLDKLAYDAKVTVNTRYYEYLNTVNPVGVSLKKAILQCETVPIIAELKTASPSKGTIRQNFSVTEIANSMVAGGAVGISVLTEPRHFNGSLVNLLKVRETVNLPILMKDILVSSIQLDAAVRTGANAVLLIQALFDRGYCNVNVDEMIADAHTKNLEVLLETHNLGEFERAIKTEADLVGINNRNLGSLTIDLNVTKNILSKQSVKSGKIIVSESGINKPSDIQVLQEYGAHAFLIGSAIMLSDDITSKIKEFTNASN